MQSHPLNPWKLFFISLKNLAWNLIKLLCMLGNAVLSWGGKVWNFIFPSPPAIEDENKHANANLNRSPRISAQVLNSEVKSNGAPFSLQVMDDEITLPNQHLAIPLLAAQKDKSLYERELKYTPPFSSTCSLINISNIITDNNSELKAYVSPLYTEIRKSSFVNFSLLDLPAHLLIYNLLPLLSVEAIEKLLRVSKYTYSLSQFFQTEINKQRSLRTALIPHPTNSQPLDEDQKLLAARDPDEDYWIAHPPAM